MLGLVKQISVGIVGDAREAAKALAYRLANRRLDSSANAKERLATIAAEKRAEARAKLSAASRVRDRSEIDLCGGTAKYLGVACPGCRACRRDQ